MIFKTQLRRKKAAGKLAADLKNLGPRVAKALEPRMAEVLEEGEAMPDVAHLLDVLGRMLEHENEALEAIDRKRGQEGSEASHARRELRGRAEPELRSRVVWVREQMRNAYGAEKANKMLRHQGRTPRALADLLIMAEDMVNFLPDAQPPRRKPGSTSNPAAWASHVRPALAECQRILKKLEKHSDERQHLVDQRNDALAIFDKNYSRLLRLAELFEQLSGLPSLAKYLRRHPGRPAEQVMMTTAADRQKAAAEKRIAAAEAAERKIVARSGAREASDRDVAGQGKERPRRRKAGPPRVA